MATDTDTDRRRTFEGVDWDRIDRQMDRTYLTVRTTGQALTLAVIGIGFLYDNLVLKNESPIFDSLVAVRHRPGETGTIGGFKLVEATWDVTSVDWMFMATIAVIGFNVVVPAIQHPRLTRYYWQQFRKNRLATVSLGVLILFFVVGTLGPVFLAPPELTFDDQYLPPVGFTASPVGQEVTGTWAHPLGTDHQGRDMLKLVVYGMRVSMEIGLIATLVATLIGTVVGATAAHVGGMVDEVLMRYVDIQSVFPAFILLLLIIYAWGAGLWIIIVLYGFFSWEGIARLIRSEALQRTEERYIQVAEAAGASRAWIIRRHIIPNVSNTIITAATLAIPSFVLGEAALAYLGLSDDSVFSWGMIIASGRGDLANAPWIATIAGLFLFVLVLAFNYVGDAMRDALDPRDVGGQ